MNCIYLNYIYLLFFAAVEANVSIYGTVLLNDLFE